MTTPESRRVAERARLWAWISAGVITAFGIVAAIASAEWWPLLLITGLALPMIPVGRTRS